MSGPDRHRRGGRAAEETDDVRSRGSLGRRLPGASDADSRAQVGIGTLVVFIAMVLVAAIAAGVLLDTAGFLQTKSEVTGTESSQQVTNRLEIVSVRAEVVQIDASGEYLLDSLTFTVRRPAGAGDVDLRNVTSVMLLDANGLQTNGFAADAKSRGSCESFFDTLSAAASQREKRSSDPDEVGALCVGRGIKDEDGSFPVLNDDGDRFVYSLYFGPQKVADEETGDGVEGPWLDAGSEAVVEFTTGSGGTRRIELTVPDTLSGESAVSL